MKFQLGDKVMIRPDSEYHTTDSINPGNTRGTVIDTYRDDYAYLVQWENGNTNNYREIDLKKLTQKGMATLNKQITPLTEFAGYSIDRNTTTVSFGCGEVKVKKSDLLAAAKAVNAGYTVNLNKIETYRVKAASANITASELTDWAAILTDQGHLKASMVFDRLANAAGSRYRKDQLLHLPALTLLQIAG